MIISRTPYRISFFGGGTDYPSWYEQETGAVLSTTIDRYCYLSCRRLPPFFPHRTRVVYSRVETVGEPEQIQHASVRNALCLLQMREGLEIHHDGDVPARSGLGTSSAFTVGLLHVLHRLRGESPGKMELALEAMHVERELNGEHVGSQDQVASALGGLNRIEFGPGHKIAATRIHVPPGRARELERHLLLCFTGQSRSASEVAAAQLGRAAANRAQLRELRALVDEAEAVLSSSGPLEPFGALLHRTWALKRGLAPQVSNELVDALYARARAAGALGGKLLGAGGGGFLLLFAAPDALPRVSAALADYVQIAFHFEDRGTQIIFEEPGDVAGR